MDKFSLAKKLVLINQNNQQSQNQSICDQSICDQLNRAINPHNLQQSTVQLSSNNTDQPPKISLFLKAKAASVTIENDHKEIPSLVSNQTIIQEKEFLSPNQLFNKVKIRIKMKENESLESIEQIESVIKPKIQLKPTIPLKEESSDEEENLPYQLDIKKFNLWSEKYRPHDLKNIIGNHDQIMQIRQWFTQFKDKDNTIKKALLFSGSPGTSKTSVAHAILREFGYDIKEYNASDVRSKKLVEANLDKLITMEQVDKHFKKNFRPFGIIMDEVDGMSSGDKGGMIQLIKIINPNRGKRSVKKEDKQKAIDRWIPPIICICNNNYDKKISELKKDCLEIKFNKPTVNELGLVIDNISRNEGFIVTDAAKKIIGELAQGDFRRLMFLLQNFSNIKKSPIDSNDIYEYYDVISKKSIDLNTHGVTERLFSKLASVEEILKLYETDKSLLPMMVHENYIEIINSQNTKANNKIINCQSCIDAIITGDIIEKIMYNTQSWYLQPIHGLNSCYIPNYYTNVYLKLAHERIKFTNTLGRFSLQRSNIKNINLVMSMLNNGLVYNVNDMHLLSEIILFHLLDSRGSQQVGIQYLKNYALCVGDLEKLIKMNKLSNKYKKLYTSRQKTQLTKLFGDVTRREIGVLSYNLGSCGNPRAFSLTGSTVIKKGKKKDDEDLDADLDQESEHETEDDEDQNDINQSKKMGKKPTTVVTKKITPINTTTVKRKYVRKKEVIPIEINNQLQAQMTQKQKIQIKIPISKKMV